MVADMEIVEMGSSKKIINKLNQVVLSLGEIPLVFDFSEKVEKFSKNHLYLILYLNIAHFQRQADLIHSLHVASQPMLVMEGYDDQTKDLAVSVNYANGNSAWA